MIFLNHINQLLQSNPNAIGRYFFYKELIKITKITRQELSPEVNSSLTKADEAETPTGAQAKVDALAGEGNTKTVKQLDDEFSSHKVDKTNPHGVTKAQVGLGNVDNVSVINEWKQKHQLTLDSGKCINISNTDLNDLVLNGDYNGQNLANAPHPTAWFYIEVFCHTNQTHHVLQRATFLSGGTGTFFRTKVNGVWGSWREFLTTDNATKSRVHDGEFQYWNGTEWVGVGGNKVAVASNNVMESRMEEVSITYNEVYEHGYKLVMKHVPKSTGEIIIKVDIKSSHLGATTNLFITNLRNANGDLLISPYPYDWRTPIDTVMPTIPSLNAFEVSHTNIMYVTKEIRMAVTYGVPIYIFLQMANTEVAIAYCRNLQICYDLV